MKTVRVIGAGLSGCEAAYQLLKRNYFVELYEVKTIKKNPIQTNDLFANLAYSDSFRSTKLTDAVGTLHCEMQLLDSLIIKAAKKAATSTTSSLVLDRNKFQSYITNYLKSQLNLKIIEAEYFEIDSDIPTIIATGPITTSNLEKAIEKLVGKNNFYLFDAVEPMILKSSIDLKNVYQQNNDLYCLLNKQQFDKIYDQLINAEIFISPLTDEIKMVHDHGLNAIETIAKKDKKLLLNTIFKAKQDSYAAVRLVQDSVRKDIYNLVGFCSSIKWPEQEKIIKNISGLANAKILRYAVMHKNDYINTAKVLNLGFQLKTHPKIFFAGQLTGVDGYVESAATAIIAAINLDRYLNKQKPLVPNINSTIGALCNYLNKTTDEIFQPIKINWALVGNKVKDLNSEKAKLKLSIKAQKAIQKYIKDINKNKSL
ncbi:methylenetetrahydrofolate--tRNA-(uracil(54)-C(5))-methyltransferase (FADH(2)-oxidizing) TrmFO [Mycoplasma putrefaciens]|uniref:Methylenetetrahydrofolate--tRNA-(uracil-5-)-methyltransferase TrmFO n=1 Tax=Mycoplasma putrefaciens Mput9231 TaxID=1292033 RepID=M9WCQ3_9MOLU|nr:methylenetetrahydrofolate--tRNA-(uracil(54)-C(5))-methyltransferase (FADH(2)-oxidizing) TrmFO [Mycoplasma putrefaciens]AGJ90616.1 Methylenetetrahydrofolate-tRNA-(uracil-5-)-methyltransferase [Mycoplasma putrefaciens Mput9231]